MVFEGLRKVGSKQLLQEVCQYLFNGQNPIYSWNDEKSCFTIRVLPDIEYNSNVNLKTSNLTNIVAKREFENAAVESLLQDLIRTKSYSNLVSNWLIKRLNRNNFPEKLTRSQMLARASISRMTIMIDVENVMLARASLSRMTIMIDVENVADYRQNFYVKSNGRIYFSSPPAPIPFNAPSLDTATNDEEDDDRIFLINGTQDDEDMLILTYAHTRSPQALWANRVTTDCRKDAADALILFDTGALQTIKNLQKILLVTHDNFAQSAEACFHSDSHPSEDDSSTLQFQW
eukprot:CAMPEP_0170066694 /NCGR_PEP_ID=MMETSP0019_2-20121128/6297_1 /TAXON_ID=98059 /ORGANISM="Dinobryon sp., Strain UTEXLB2267" /LENGTH=288 /DNA_ID=CAMNT_0010273851 /DNA_START=38 /DNA_END=901 /DNA_ORIENTATION=+